MKSSDGTDYRLCGPQQAAVVTLIHGIGLNKRLWRQYEAALCKRYRVLSYDLPGHGDSARPVTQVSLSSLTTQLCELLDELAVERCAIVGFSMGGMINRHFAMRYRERVGALIVLNSPHERSPEAQKMVEDLLARTAEGGAAATIESSLERWFTAQFLATQTETVEQVRQWALATDPGAFTDSRAVLANGVKQLIRPHPPVRAPTLTITCENDSGSTPEMAHRISAEICGAQTLVVPALRHLGLLEQPERFIRPVMAFLDEAPDWK